MSLKRPFAGLRFRDMRLGCRVLHRKLTQRRAVCTCFRSLRRVNANLRVRLQIVRVRREHPFVCKLVPEWILFLDDFFGFHTPPDWLLLLVREDTVDLVALFCAPSEHPFDCDIFLSSSNFTGLLLQNRFKPVYPLFDYRFLRFQTSKSIREDCYLWRRLHRCIIDSDSFGSFGIRWRDLTFLLLRRCNFRDGFA